MAEYRVHSGTTFGIDYVLYKLFFYKHIFKNMPKFPVFVKNPNIIMYVRQFAPTIMDNSLGAVLKDSAYDWIKSKITYKS